jgi:hypothetical protein
VEEANQRRAEEGLDPLTLPPDLDPELPHFSSNAFSGDQILSDDTEYVMDDVPDDGECFTGTVHGDGECVTNDDIPDSGECVIGKLSDDGETVRCNIPDDGETARCNVPDDGECVIDGDGDDADEKLLVADYEDSDSIVESSSTGEQEGGAMKEIFLQQRLGNMISI